MVFMRFSWTGRLIGLALIFLSTTSIQSIKAAGLEYDAVAGSTALTNVPPPPSLSITSSSPAISNNMAQLDQSGGLFTINYSATDPVAILNSLEIGALTPAGVCDPSGSGLPAGATFQSTSISQTQSTASITWNVPAGTQATTITPCAFNSYWVQGNGVTKRAVSVMAGVPVKKINITAASYTAKSRTLMVKGVATKASSRVNLSGTVATVDDAISGNTLAAGIINPSGSFSISLVTPGLYLPANSVVVTISGLSSSAKKLSLIGKLPSGSASGSETITFGALSNTLASVGSLYTYQISAQDSLGNPLSFTLISGPPGMTVTPSGLLTWTPQGGDLNTSPSYTIQATSSTGVSSSHTQSVAVCPTGQMWMDSGCMTM
jgi:hypothetical protein